MFETEEKIFLYNKFKIAWNEQWHILIPHFQRSFFHRHLSFSISLSLLLTFDVPCCHSAFDIWRLKSSFDIWRLKSSFEIWRSMLFFNVLHLTSSFKITVLSKIRREMSFVDIATTQLHFKFFCRIRTHELSVITNRPYLCKGQVVKICTKYVNYIFWVLLDFL